MDFIDFVICFVIMASCLVLFAFIVSKGKCMDKIYMSLVGGIILTALAECLLITPAVETRRKVYSGVPITTEFQSLEDHKFSPLAFIVTLDKPVLIYNSDGKVYSLDGIRMEKGLVPGNLEVGIGITYTVYRKSGKLVFGRVGSENSE